MFAFALFVILLLPNSSSKSMNKRLERPRYSAVEYNEMRVASETSCIVKRSEKDPNCSVMNPKCLLYYFHIHKTGGTSLCRTANANRFKTTGVRGNCNIPKHIIAKIQYLVARNISFVAQEGGEFIPIKRKAIRPVYIITIRDPLDRALSHIHHGLCIPGSNEIKEMTEMGCDFDAGKHSFADVILNVCFDKLFYVQNFYVQQLGGCSHNHCTEQHLQYAIDALNVMSAVVVTEEFERHTSMYRYVIQYLIL